MKSKYTAGILAFLFGVFGTHKFYLGKSSSGFFRLGLFVFSAFTIAAFGRFLWLILMILAFIESIVLFAMDDSEFDEKYNKDSLRSRRRNNRDFNRQGERERNERFREEYRRAQRSADRPVRKQHRSVKKVNPHKRTGIQKYKDYDYEGAVEEFEKALEIDSEDVATHFNLACAYSLIENANRSIFHLAKAVELGFDDFNRIHQHDALAYLRVQEEFETFVKNKYKLPQPPEPQPAQLESPKEDLLDDLKEQPTILEQLSKLGDLKERGIITDEEFQLQKKKILR